MVGIDVRKGFTELRNVDQFALIGISPKIKLTFEELVKQATRVAALLHSDSKKPPNVTPPFSSSTANDLKGWLQSNANSQANRKKAVKVFYTNTTGHRGLTWQPYLKNGHGVLVPRTDPAIWRNPNYKPPVPPIKKPPAPKKDAPHVPGRKRRTYAGKPSAHWRDDCSSSNGPIPERERRTYGTKASANRRSSWFQSANGPVSERSRASYASKPMSREQPGQRDRADTPPTRSSPPPLRAATSGQGEESQEDGYADMPSIPRSSSAESPPDTQWTLEDLIALADMTGEYSRCRIAVASLPDQQDCVVIMESQPPCKLRFRVEKFDVLGRSCENDCGRPYWITYDQMISGRHRFLGPFAGATQTVLESFASSMYFAKADDSQGYAESLPYAPGSPSWYLDD